MGAFTLIVQMIDSVCIEKHSIRVILANDPSARRLFIKSNNSLVNWRRYGSMDV